MACGSLAALSAAVSSAVRRSPAARRLASSCPAVRAPRIVEVTPGRPVTWVTTDGFLDHFGLEGREALPGLEELRAAGLLDARSAISTLGAQAMAAIAPREDMGDEVEDGEIEESGSAHDFDSVVAAAEAAVEDEEDDLLGR